MYIVAFLIVILAVSQSWFVFGKSILILFRISTPKSKGIVDFID